MSNYQKFFETTTKWEENFGAWLDWKKEHPDESVPLKRIHNGLNIGTWANGIRAADRPGSKRIRVTDEQRKKLNDAGFIWEPLEYTKRARLQSKKV